MKITKHDLNRFLCLLLWALCVPVAYAELTATVYPGYTLSANERPTTAILNLLARPTITVSGTLGGTNVGLAANSVSGAMLQASVVDDNTIEFFNNGGSTAIRLKAYNTGTNAISSNLAGLGLGGGDGYALSNKTDNATITITNDVLTLKSNLSPVYLQWVTNTLLGAATYGTNAHLSTPTGFYIETNAFKQLVFESSEYSVTGSGTETYSVAHGLGGTPRSLRPVFVCKTAEYDFTVGEEIDLRGVESSTLKYLVSTCSANTTNVKIRFQLSGVVNWRVLTSGAINDLTPANWRLKVYAFR
jgi:hypothetical protein